MSDVPAWYERKFEFTFPAELYPNLCVRLRGVPARLEEMLRVVSREKLTGKPEGKWSMQEHAGHLVELEPLWLARVEDFAKGGDTLTVTDLSNRGTDQANYNARDLKDILALFRNARMNLVNRLEGIEPAQFRHTVLHPRLKQPMRLVDHLFFVAEHDDHHLARIWEMIRG
jgi:uncharacterized damage-inducible protein DinB